MKETARAETIILNATVLTSTEPALPDYPRLRAENPEAGGVAHLQENHAIGIAAGEIIWVKPSADVTPVERESAELIDGAGHVAIPGLINCHTHSAMTMFRNSAEDVVTAT